MAEGVVKLVFPTTRGQACSALMAIIMQSLTTQKVNWSESSLTDDDQVEEQRQTHSGFWLQTLLLRLSLKRNVVAAARLGKETEEKLALKLLHHDCAVKTVQKQPSVKAFFFLLLKLLLIQVEGFFFQNLWQFFSSVQHRLYTLFCINTAWKSMTAFEVETQNEQEEQLFIRTTRHSKDFRSRFPIRALLFNQSKRSMKRPIREKAHHRTSFLMPCNDRVITNLIQPRNQRWLSCKKKKHTQLVPMFYLIQSQRRRQKCCFRFSIPNILFLVI